MFKASLFVVSLIVCLISPSTIAAPASETVSPTFKRDFHCANGVSMSNTTIFRMNAQQAGPAVDQLSQVLAEIVVNLGRARCAL
ncbi:hypothetical protein E4T56_gene20996 [Termitomyces sp. T112]|nr:hypothetical protein E4T56_gene20996 [Termitomyces sp. T112]